MDLFQRLSTQVMTPLHAHVLCMYLCGCVCGAARVSVRKRGCQKLLPSFPPLFWHHFHMLTFTHTHTHCQFDTDACAVLRNWLIEVDMRKAKPVVANWDKWSWWWSRDKQPVSMSLQQRKSGARHGARAQKHNILHMTHTLWLNIPEPWLDWYHHLLMCKCGSVGAVLTFSVQLLRSYAHVEKNNDFILSPLTLKPDHGRALLHENMHRPLGIHQKVWPCFNHCSSGVQSHSVLHIYRGTQEYTHWSKPVLSLEGDFIENVEEQLNWRKMFCILTKSDFYFQYA